MKSVPNVKLSRYRRVVRKALKIVSLWFVCLMVFLFQSASVVCLVCNLAVSVRLSFLAEQTTVGTASETGSGTNSRDLY